MKLGCIAQYLKHIYHLYLTDNPKLVVIILLNDNKDITIIVIIGKNDPKINFFIIYTSFFYILTQLKIVILK